MNKRFLIILIILITIAFGLGLVLLLRNNSSEDLGGSGEKQRDFFSFISKENRLKEDQLVEKPDFNRDDFSEENGNKGESAPKIRVISEKETSGYGLFDNNGSTTIRFVDRESGNIFEADSASLHKKRVTNTTILQTIDSLWIDINKLVLQYIDENGNIQTFSASIEKDQSEEAGVGTLIGSFAEKNIDQLDVYNGKIFTLIESGSGSVGVIRNSNLGGVEVVLNTPLREIRGLWAGLNTIAINTKPSSGSSGFLFYLNTSSGALSQIINRVNGLNTNVSKDHSGILYNQSENIGVSLWFLDTKTNERRKLDKSTIVDKCVWSNSLEERVVYCAIPKNISVRNLPDEWYLGNISFNDDIWKIDLETGEDNIVLESGVDISREVDVIKLGLNKNNSYLVFVNKTDSSLWGINLEKE